MNNQDFLDRVLDASEKIAKHHAGKTYDQIKQLFDDFTEKTNKEIVGVVATLAGFRSSLDALDVVIPSDLEKQFDHMMGQITASTTELQNEFAERLVAFGNAQNDTELEVRSFVQSLSDELTVLTDVVDKVSESQVETRSLVTGLCEQQEVAGKTVLGFADVVRRAVSESREDVKKDIKTSLGTLESLFEKRLAEEREAQDRATRSMVDLMVGEFREIQEERTAEVERKLLHFVREQSSGRNATLLDAKKWQPDEVIKQFDLRRHRGGLWQCARTTADEPCIDSPDWINCAVGLDAVVVESTHKNNLDFALTVVDSTGEHHTNVVPLPRLDYTRGTYDKDAVYSEYDTVLYNRTRWVATVDEPRGAPGENGCDDWQVEAMSGAAGKRGPRGLQGEPGRDGVDAEVDTIEGLPIRRWCGNHVTGESYMRGDVVMTGSARFVSLKDHVSNLSPDKAPDYWTIF